MTLARSSEDGNDDVMQDGLDTILHFLGILPHQLWTFPCEKPGGPHGKAWQALS
jgi:hypothetical protein